MTPRNRTVWILVGIVGVLVIVVVVLAVALIGSDDGATTSSLPARRPTTSTTPAVTSVPPSVPSAPTSTTSTPAGAVSVQDVTVQEGIVQRQYLVVRPVDVGADERLPAVMVLHGLTVDRFAMAATAPWAEAVARDRFVAVFPQGILSSWNAGPCCPPATLASVDDVGFLTRVVDQLRARPDVDPDRLYLTGFSNGGMMAYTLACARTEDFAAVAPMAATNVSGCSPSRPISLLHMHGDRIRPSPTTGRRRSASCCRPNRFPRAGIGRGVGRGDGCGTDPERRSPTDGVTIDSWPGCPRGIRVELITYPGNGHAWPTAPLDGLDVMLRFFGISG